MQPKKLVSNPAEYIVLDCHMINYNMHIEITCQGSGPADDLRIFRMEKREKVSQKMEAWRVEKGSSWL